MPTPPRLPALPTPARVFDMASYNSVAVIGAGAWGTALATVARRAGRDVTLYARSAAGAARMKATRENLRLPGIRLDTGVEVTGDSARAGIAVGRRPGRWGGAGVTGGGSRELGRPGRAWGARGETLSGLSGLGDLILTGPSPQARTPALGTALGRGEPPPQGRLAEGQ